MGIFVESLDGCQVAAIKRGFLFVFIIKMDPFRILGRSIHLEEGAFHFSWRRGILFFFFFGGGELKRVRRRE